MKIRVQLFAGAKQLAGRDHVELTVPEQASVSDLRQALVQTVPGLEPLLQRARIAIDLEFADDATPIGPTSEIAVIPPVSGG
ncbi:MAG: molybdopterin converting factor, subunit 1 [Planctomycetota bacterium]|jgi:molybdopterin converting factor subunit 1